MSEPHEDDRSQQRESQHHEARSQHEGLGALEQAVAGHQSVSEQLLVVAQRNSDRRVGHLGDRDEPVALGLEHGDHPVDQLDRA
ncbi:MAG: hypothetical protein V9E94_04475 [Microthrixaceae bacterium]